MNEELQQPINISPNFVISKFNEINNEEIKSQIFKNLEDLRNKRIDKQVCKTVIKTIITPYPDVVFIFELYLLLNYEL